MTHAALCLTDQHRFVNQCYQVYQVYFDYWIYYVFRDYLDYPDYTIISDIIIAQHINIIEITGFTRLIQITCISQ